MNRDDVIRMAREAGALQVGFNKTIMQSEYSMFAHELEVFAAAAFAAGAAAEREACVKVCENLIAWDLDDPGSTAANAIRARGQI